ncbi:tetratricopeptide repeat protein [Patulibacter sp.]|uniref:tetratricopeptide repeat protein n=1 Tax=Patulibacter sp. TaxID=1912859 RepID=UPI002728BA9D|nr:tetratricopeptide repeat protein [Patulibacter sp.]MDO9406776.1 tetratricopeptide repeat protein [Patulibacter sp.]
MSPAPRLYLSHDAQLHVLLGLEFGRVGDDQPRGCWAPVSETFAYLLDVPGGRAVGFGIDEFDAFDPDDPAVAEIWDGPRFDVPALALTDACAGEIAVAARHRFGDEDSLNRRLFSLATQHPGEEALALWRECLETGDGLAHFGLGYTLMDLDRPREAYAHLRHAAAIAPEGAWTWCWLGQAAESIGELGEAREAYLSASRLATGPSAGARDDAYRRLCRLRRIAPAEGVITATRTDGTGPAADPRSPGRGDHPGDDRPDG